jgi:putative addiction module component (TIGR02574 family)
MSALLDELSCKAKELALDERALLAQQLMESVEQETDPDVQAAWESEIEFASRIARYERGEAKLIPAADVFEAARHFTR